jgi:hypothetical protein
MHAWQLINAGGREIEIVRDLLLVNQLKSCRFINNPKDWIEKRI